LNDHKVKPPISDPDVESLDKEGVQQLNKIESHYIHLRWVAVGVAITFVIVLGFLERRIVDHLTELSGIGNLFVLVAITPVISITTIVAILLFGVFRQDANASVKLPKTVTLGLSQSSKGGQE